jgi:tRNA U55 pseudouridine synthase TruB
LIRLASGRFKIDDAVTLDNLLTAENWTQFVIAPQTALADWPAVHLTAEDADHILHGRAIQHPDSDINDLAFAYAPDGQLIAIVQAGDGLLRPHKVFL